MAGDRQKKEGKKRVAARGLVGPRAAPLEQKHFAWGPPVRQCALACVRIHVPPPRKRKYFFPTYTRQRAVAINSTRSDGSSSPISAQHGTKAVAISSLPPRPTQTQRPIQSKSSRDDQGRRRRRRIGQPDGRRRPGPRNALGRRRSAAARRGGGARGAGGHHVCGSLLRQEVLLHLRRRAPPALSYLLPLLPRTPPPQPRAQEVTLLPAPAPSPGGPPAAAPLLLPRHGSPGARTRSPSFRL